MDGDTSSPHTTLHDEWELVDDNAETSASVSTLHGAKLKDSEYEENGVTHEVPEGTLPIRLRQGEKIRSTWFKATQRVDEFVTKFFADELAKGKKVRLIYMGMLLLPSRTMGEYGIEKNGVIHSVITDAPPIPTSHVALHTKFKPLDSHNSLLALTGTFLYGMWTLFYHFPDFFTWKSIALLALFSAMHIMAMVSRVTSH